MLFIHGKIKATIKQKSVRAKIEEKEYRALEFCIENFKKPERPFILLIAFVNQVSEGDLTQVSQSVAAEILKVCVPAALSAWLKFPTS